ncbi:cholecystokinin receptor [Electrophorus electricus]|uniref:cholecystokinin receptor n=1 Tax=Electrophorus electricus TaxID=8005 RepID=UPI0015D0839B|nr:cholecystokinin receptor [Electrophorus electricus]
MDLQMLTEILECLRALNGTALNGTANLSLEFGPNSICGDDPLAPKAPPSRPKEMDSVRILLYSLIFLLSVFGNLLIIVVLAVNKRMRTVTNSFLLSLALSDLMTALFCMPFTLIPNLLGDFIFGAAMCKIVAYLMGISVSISTFSLMAIAIERYSAICNPLKSRAWQTRSHAYRVIAVTWVLSFLIMTPYPVFSTLIRYTKPNNLTGHMCRHDWPMEQVNQAWCILLLFVLFFIPGVVMIVAYGLISRELYRGMRFEMDQRKVQCVTNNGTASVLSDDGDGCYIQVSKRPSSMEMSAITLTSSAKVERLRSNTSETTLMAKKRVIRMLIVVVTVFFVCWMPLYSANTWKAFHPPSAKRALSGAPISFIHLLSYTSACVNPVIYCFMNKRFRKALLTTFACCCGGPCARRRIREGGEDDATAAAGSMSKFTYTTVSTVGSC